MINMETTPSTALAIPFRELNGDTGIEEFDLIVLKDGGIYTNFTSPPVFTEIGEGLYTLTATFTETGVYTFYIDNRIAALVSVNDRSLRSYLANIEDEALGSWSWNKSTNQLTLYRINGQSLASFTLTDTDSLSQRERT